jgi:hypothetical protein
MTTTAPPPEALAAAHSPIVISQFHVLLDDIAEAKAKAADVTFDYADPKGNKQARSYIFSQRKLNARIESARTDAKSYALAYGRKVDEQAAELKDQVAALIKPHQDAIDAIAKAEADRVRRHRDVIDGIRAYGNVGFGATSEAIGYWLAEAKATDIDGLEEFKEEAAAALLETIRTLEAAHTKALADEVAAAELAQLREQQRIQKEKEAEDARIKAQQEAVAEAVRKAQEEADAAAIAAVEESERKAAEAQARADAAEAALARQQAIDAARDQEEADKTVRAMYLEELEAAVGEAPEALLAIKPAMVPEPPGIEISDKAVAGVSAVDRRPVRLRDTHEAYLPAQQEAVFFAAKQQAPATSDLLRLRDEIAERMKPLSRIGVADALVAGTLHPAIKVDWSKV